MDRNEWYRTGEDIRDQVQRAVETGNFTNLGKNISDTVNETLNHTVREMNHTVGTVGESVNRTVEAVGDSISRAVNDVTQGFAPKVPDSAAVSYANRREYRRPNARLDTRLFQRTPSGSVSGVVFMGAGYGLMGMSLLVLAGSVGELMLYSASVVPVGGSGGFSVAGLW
ncbi:MAG: hypothetical protein K2O15_08750, partial [Lachnospiraceae bacterium]|nr:hypothetical protein [Lachnospiraceae bacterium]